MVIVGAAVSSCSDIAFEASPFEFSIESKNTSFPFEFSQPTDQIVQVIAFRCSSVLAAGFYALVPVYRLSLDDLQLQAFDIV